MFREVPGGVDVGFTSNVWMVGFKLRTPLPKPATALPFTNAYTNSEPWTDPESYLP